MKIDSTSQVLLHQILLILNMMLFLRFFISWHDGAANAVT